MTWRRVRDASRQLVLWPRDALPLALPRPVPAAASREPSRPQGARAWDRWPLVEFAMGEGLRLALPPSLQAIADVIGRRQALVLSDRLPQTGRRARRRMLYVPERLHPSHRLIAILGVEDAERLSAEFPRMILEVPICRDLRMAYRDSVIARLHRTGVPMGLIGEATQVGPEAVRAVIAREAPEAGPLALPHHRSDPTPEG